MRILTRYLCREVALATLVVLLALTMLFAFFDLIHELGDIGKGSYRIGGGLLFVALNMPAHVYELFPIAALIGTLYALSQLASHSELAVMRVSGLSLGAIARAVLPVGILFVLAMLFVGEVATPVLEKIAQETKLRLTESLIAQEFRSGVWVKDEGSFVNVQEVRPGRGGTRLFGIKIYQFDPGYKLKSISLAREGAYLGQNRWQILDVHQTIFSDTGTSLQTLPEAVWKSVLTPNILSVLLVVPEQMSVWNLYTYIQHLRDNAQNSTRYEIAIWSKLIYPCAVLVMIVLAVPFSVSSRRTSGVGARLLIGTLIGLAFNSANRLFSSLGQLHGMSAFASAVLPTLIFLAAAVSLLYISERNMLRLPFARRTP
jgi:lipopolysaccharide export system permease protein